MPRTPVNTATEEVVNVPTEMDAVDSTPSAPVQALLPRDENGGIKLRSIWDIVNDLSRPLPDNLVRTRRQGNNNNIRYIAWHDATRVLDRYAPGWSYEVKFLSHIKDKVVLIARIAIPTLEGLIVREATGNEDDVTSSYGDSFSNSESMALRRAAAKFGLGRWLYNG